MNKTIHGNINDRQARNSSAPVVYVTDSPWVCNGLFSSAPVVSVHHMRMRFFINICWLLLVSRRQIGVRCVLAYNPLQN